MAKYMLLLYDNRANWTDISPDEMQTAIQKYKAWGDKLKKLGIYVSSHKLADDAGKVLRGRSQPRVTDGPYSETKEVLGGYFMIEAPSYDDAVGQSRDCPHLEYGGTIEVRQVDPMAGDA
jgi:hypothetical protein